jgi:hypothetical protein
MQNDIIKNSKTLPRMNTNQPKKRNGLTTKSPSSPRHTKVIELTHSSLDGWAQKFFDSFVLLGVLGDLVVKIRFSNSSHRAYYYFK